MREYHALYRNPWTSSAFFCPVEKKIRVFYLQWKSTDRNAALLQADSPFACPLSQVPNHLD
jgi:hypothetical protein